MDENAFSSWVKRKITQSKALYFHLLFLPSKVFTFLIHPRRGCQTCLRVLGWQWPVLNQWFGPICFWWGSGWLIFHSFKLTASMILLTHNQGPIYFEVFLIRVTNILNILMQCQIISVKSDWNSLFDRCIVWKASTLNFTFRTHLATSIESSTLHCLMDSSTSTWSNAKIHRGIEKINGSLHANLEQGCCFCIFLDSWQTSNSIEG